MSRSLRPAPGRRRFFRAATVLAAMVLAGCGGATAPIDDARAARARWDRTHPAHYAYTLTRSCECLPETTAPVRIEVRGGVVQSRLYVATGTPVDARWAAFFPTIDGLFVTIEDASRRAERMDAEYDGQFGYPRRVSIDYTVRAADDEIGLYVRDFQALP